jgi:hypothetical protein
VNKYYIALGHIGIKRDSFSKMKSSIRAQLREQEKVAKRQLMIMLGP